jgi:GxxExxY protein
MLFAREDTSKDPLTGKIIGAAIEVHRNLGPGLLESVYEQCLCYELSQLGLSFVRQAPMPVKYKDILIDAGFKIDILVENQVILELKVCDAISPVHEAQLLTYMKLAKVQRGLLLNFNVLLMKDGIKRYVI